MRASKLAHYLGVPPDYVHAMRFCGFPMPGGRNTPAEARKWLRKNPDFRTDAAKHTRARPALRLPGGSAPATQPSPSAPAKSVSTATAA